MYLVTLGASHWIRARSLSVAPFFRSFLACAPQNRRPGIAFQGQSSPFKVFA